MTISRLRTMFTIKGVSYRDRTCIRATNAENLEVRTTENYELFGSSVELHLKLLSLKIFKLKVIGIIKRVKHEVEHDSDHSYCRLMLLIKLRRLAGANCSVNSVHCNKLQIKFFNELQIWV